MTPERVWSSHSLPVTDLHLGVGGHLSRVVSSSLDQTCRLFDVNSGELLCTFVFEVGICSVVLDPAEFRLFAGSSSGSIYAVNLFETVSVIRCSVHNQYKFHPTTALHVAPLITKPGHSVLIKFVVSSL